MMMTLGGPGVSWQFKNVSYVHHENVFIIWSQVMLGAIPLVIDNELQKMSKEKKKKMEGQLNNKK